MVHSKWSDQSAWQKLQNKHFSQMGGLTWKILSFEKLHKEQEVSEEFFS